MERARALVLFGVTLMTACGGSGGGAADAQTCGCPSQSPGGSCLSLNVIEWVDRAPVVSGTGLTAYLVSENDYDEHAAPLAVAVPDGAGRVVFEAIGASSGRVYVVLDDDSAAAEDSWTHMGVGPFELPGVFDCVRAPALTRVHGDGFFEDLGHTPGEGEIFAGAVLLEIVDEFGELRESVGITMFPAAVNGFFTADRQHIDQYLTSTTAAGAVFTVPATYCSVFCRNFDCGCVDPSCGYQFHERGGTDWGLLYQRMSCHR